MENAANSIRETKRECETLARCSSPNIVSFHGAIFGEADLALCLEYMDRGSLETVMKRKGPLPEPILGQIIVSVLDGLVYLYAHHKIIHRGPPFSTDTLIGYPVLTHDLDIKPSNILVNSKGEVKIADFGTSNVATNSVANTFVGTRSYMAVPGHFRLPYHNVDSMCWM